MVSGYIGFLGNSTLWLYAENVHREMIVVVSKRKEFMGADRIIFLICRKDFVNATFWSYWPFGLVLKTLASYYLKKQLKC